MKTLSDRHLERLAQIVHAQAGITLGVEKRTMIEARLAKYVRSTGRPIEGILAALESEDRDRVLDDLLDVLTTNFTSFFREAAHFDWLANTWYGPQRRAARVWCAAAATGEEPYSLAIALGEAAAQHGMLFGVELHATDLSRRALEVARLGIYPGSHVESLDRARVRRWFQRGVNAQDGTVRVKRELRDAITFARHNLLDPPPFEGLDLIFLRNVMIYFDDETQAQVLAHMHGALARGGMLVVGHAENVRRLTHGFRMHSHTILEKL